MIAIRRQGIYFAMITLALSQLCTSSTCRPVHPRRRRHPGHPARLPVRGAQSRQSDGAVLRHLAGFLLGFLLIFRTINSPFGEVLKAIRENEQRAISLGYKTDHYKLLAFILSGTLADLRVR